MGFSDIIYMLREQRHPFRFLASRILARTGISRMLNLKIQRNGYQLHFFNTALSMNLWIHANERSEDVEIIKIMLPAGGTYVDIGANIGDLVLAGAVAVGDEGKVFAFEAHPRIFSLMCRNLSLIGHPNIYPVNVACGEEFGWTRFSNMRSDDMNQIGTGEISVPILPAQYLLPNEKIDLIKVDVEGFELYVLKGLQGVLGHTRHLLIEVGNQHFERVGYKFADIYDLLTTNGFTIFAKSGGEFKDVWFAIRDRNQPFPMVQNVIASRDPELLKQLTR
jgi:FkbM family methyltransferase